MLDAGGGSELAKSEVPAVEFGPSARDHQKLTLDVAYVGTHGYDEIHTIDLNEAAIGSGWDVIPRLLGTVAKPGCIGVGTRWPNLFSNPWLPTGSLSPTGLRCRYYG